MMKLEHYYKWEATMRIVESKFKQILNDLPRLSAKELDIIKQRTTSMLQELDLEATTQERRHTLRYK